MDRVKRIWYLSPMRAAKVQASLRIRAVSPEPPLLAHTSSESRGTFRQKTRSLAPLNGWACAVEICHDGMLEDTNSLDGAHIILLSGQFFNIMCRRFVTEYMGNLSTVYYKLSDTLCWEHVFPNVSTDITYNGGVAHASKWRRFRFSWARLPLVLQGFSIMGDI